MQLQNVIIHKTSSKKLMHDLSIPLHRIDTKNEPPVSLFTQGRGGSSTKRINRFGNCKLEYHPCTTRVNGSQ